MSFWSNWWNRPAGGKEIVRIATPMIISSGSFALMQLTDRVFLTWYDPQAMGASFTAGQVIWLLAAFPFYIAGYTNAFVAQYNGAGKIRQIAPFVWQGIYIGLLLFPLFFLLSFFCDIPFRLFHHTEEMIAQEVTYSRILLYSTSVMIINESLSSFFSGRKEVGVVMKINVLTVFLNVVLDYILIFGIGDWCHWGLAGAAWATTISQWVRLLLYLFLVWRDNRRSSEIEFFRHYQLRWREMKALIKYGGMSGIQFFADVATFTFFIMLIGMVGEKETMVSAIAFNLNALAFLPIVGAGIAVVTLVGNQLGANQPKLAKRATLTALELTIGLNILFIITFVFCPDFFLILYSWENPEKFLPLHDLTVVLLRYVSIYMLFDTIGIVFGSAIRGAGDTRFPMLVTFIMAPVLLVPELIGVLYFNGGIHWCWSLLTPWIALQSAIYCTRFFQGKWMKMRLFEIKGLEKELS